MKGEEVLQSKQWKSYWLEGTEVLIGSSCVYVRGMCVCVCVCVLCVCVGEGKNEN